MLSPFIVYPLDGIKEEEMLLGKLEALFEIESVLQVVSHIKVNDAVHGHGGPAVLEKLRNKARELGSAANLFLDLKLADTNGTDVNTVDWYLPVLQWGDILTVRSSCSTKAFRELREKLPGEVKIALVSMLTDTSVDECRRRHGMFPWVKILNDMVNLNAEWEEQGCDDVHLRPFDATVCSPLEVEHLRRNFPEMEFIVPGIRDVWMTAGQQARFTGVGEALKKGATYAVMGSQLAKGNPKNGISSKESVRMTIAEITKVLIKMKG